MDVSAEEAEECGMSLASVVPIASLEYDVPASVWVIWNVDANASEAPSATFGCTLKFIAKEIDPSNGMPEEEGYDDEYALESVDVGLKDYVTPLFVGDFEKNWNENKNGEVVETYSLTAVQSIKGMKSFLLYLAAVSTVVELLGMDPINETGTLQRDTQTTHTLLLAGQVLIEGGKMERCLVRCRMAYDPSSGVTMEIGARGPNRSVNERIANCIT
jgi:coatomer protein complex subunit gamma